MPTPTRSPARRPTRRRALFAAAPTRRRSRARPDAAQPWQSLDFRPVVTIVERGSWIEGAEGMSASVSPQRRFQLILIKPSHYDDDGYVIQWFRSVMPSNSLAALYGLAVDADERQVLGPDIAIDVTPIDETNTRIRPDKIIADLKRNGGFGLVGLVGVQSNQFPRAMDIARALRAAGVPVVIGGFHVSGCLSMLPGIQPDLQEAIDLGISLFAGEAEDRLDGLLRDAVNGEMKPVYNYLKDLPGIE